MADDTRTTPRLSAKGQRVRETQRAREAEALRENLLKRKAQARARAADAGPAGAPGDEDSGTEGDDRT